MTNTDPSNEAIWPTEEPSPPSYPDDQPQPQAQPANGNGKEDETISDLVRKAREGIPVDAHGLQPTEYQHQVTIAKDRARAYLMLPDHLHNNTAVMTGLVAIAARFNLDPLMLAAQTYVQNNRLCFQAQAFGAILYGSKLLKGRLQFIFHGEKEERTCTVRGVFRDDPDTFCEATTPPIKDLHPGYSAKEGKAKFVRGSPLWDKDPEQQLAYFAERRWIRRFAPDACMGMYTREEVMELDDYRAGREGAIPLTSDRLGQLKTGEGWGEGAHVDLDLAAIAPAQPEMEPELEPVPTWTPSEAPRGFRKQIPRPATRKPAHARKPAAKGKTAPPQKTRSAKPAGRQAPPPSRASVKAAADRAERPPRPAAHRPTPWVDYVAKTEAWIKAVTTAEQGDAADQRWEAERDVRDKIQVPMGERSRLRAILDRKVAVVRPKKEEP